jgi:hypothetical protein
MGPPGRWRGSLTNVMRWFFLTNKGLWLNGLAHGRLTWCVARRRQETAEVEKPAEEDVGERREGEEGRAPAGEASCAVVL